MATHGQPRIRLSKASKNLALGVHIADLKPSSLKSDQHQFSPNYINTSPRERVRRINKMMNKEEMLCSFIKFSQLILLNNVCTRV